MRTFNTIGELEIYRLACDRLEELHLIEKDEYRRQTIEEQYEELSDYIAMRERNARKGAISDVARLKVEDIYGSWYYQQIRVSDEDSDKWDKVYNLYDSDGEYVDEFYSISDMKHYVRTGRRC